MHIYYNRPIGTDKGGGSPKVRLSLTLHSFGTNAVQVFVLEGEHHNRHGMIGDFPSEHLMWTLWCLRTRQYISQ